MRISDLHHGRKCDYLGDDGVVVRGAIGAGNAVDGVVAYHMVSVQRYAPPQSYLCHQPRRRVELGERPCVVEHTFSFNPDSLNVRVDVRVEELPRRVPDTPACHAVTAKMKEMSEPSADHVVSRHRAIWVGEPRYTRRGRSLAAVDNDSNDVMPTTSLSKLGEGFVRVGVCGAVGGFWGHIRVLGRSYYR